MKPKKMLITLLIAAVGIGALTGLSVLTAVCVSANMTWTPVPSDCIIVLGAHVWMDGHLSNVLDYRLETAKAAWERGLAPTIILCGGQGRDEPRPEAEAMAEALMARGVSPECLIVENTSSNTQQNLENAKAIMDKRNMKTAIVCTSDYHLRRALWLSRDAGITATGLPAPSTRDFFSLIRGRLRETCSWILYFIRRLL